MSAYAAPDFERIYNDCVKAAKTDAESDRCLNTTAVDVDRRLGEVVGQLVAALNASEDLKPKAKLLEDAHAKWLPSRDADCQLRAAVTMESEAEAADARRLCTFEANLPRLNQYERFLGFVAR